MNVRLSTALLAAAGVVALPASAQQVGDVERGRDLSVQLCADCHAVVPGVERSPDRHAPTFEQIANTSGMTAMALSVWLHSSHPTMPLIRLEADVARDVTAYILSQKRPRPR